MWATPPGMGDETLADIATRCQLHVPLHDVALVCSGAQLTTVLRASRSWATPLCHWKKRHEVLQLVDLRISAGVLRSFDPAHGAPAQPLLLVGTVE